MFEHPSESPSSGHEPERPAENEITIDYLYFAQQRAYYEFLLENPHLTSAQGFEFEKGLEPLQEQQKEWIQGLAAHMTLQERVSMIGKTQMLQRAQGELSRIFDPDIRPIEHLSYSARITGSGLDDIIRVARKLEAAGAAEQFATLLRQSAVSIGAHFARQLNEDGQPEAVARPFPKRDYEMGERAKTVRSPLPSSFRLEEELIFQALHLLPPSIESHHSVDDSITTLAAFGSEALLARGAKGHMNQLAATRAFHEARDAALPVIAALCTGSEDLPPYSATELIGKAFDHPLPPTGPASVTFPGSIVDNSCLGELFAEEASGTAASAIRTVLNSGDAPLREWVISDKAGNSLLAVHQTMPSDLNREELLELSKTTTEAADELGCSPDQLCRISLEVVRHLEIEKPRDLSTFQQVYELGVSIAREAFRSFDQSSYEETPELLVSDVHQLVRGYFEGARFTPELLEASGLPFNLDQNKQHRANLIRLASSLRHAFGSDEEVVSAAEVLQESFDEKGLRILTKGPIVKIISGDSRVQSREDAEAALQEIAELTRIGRKGVAHVNDVPIEKKKDGIDVEQAIKASEALLIELNAIGNRTSLAFDFKLLRVYLHTVGPQVLPYTFGAIFACHAGAPIQTVIRDLAAQTPTNVDFQRWMSANHRLKNAYPEALEPYQNVRLLLEQYEKQDEKGGSLLTPILSIKDDTVQWSVVPGSGELSVSRRDAGGGTISKQGGFHVSFPYFEPMITGVAFDYEKAHSERDESVIGTFAALPELDVTKPCTAQEFYQWFRTIGREQGGLQRMFFDGAEKTPFAMVTHPIIFEAFVHSLAPKLSEYPTPHLDRAPLGGPRWRRSHHALLETDRIALVMSPPAPERTPPLVTLPDELKDFALPQELMMKTEKLSVNAGARSSNLTPKQREAYERDIARQENSFRSAARRTRTFDLDKFKDDFGGQLQKRLKSSKAHDEAAIVEGIAQADSLSEILTVVSLGDVQSHQMAQKFANAFSRAVLNEVDLSLLPKEESELGNPDLPLHERAARLYDYWIEIRNNLMAAQPDEAAKEAADAFLSLCMDERTIRKVLDTEESAFKEGDTVEIHVEAKGAGGFTVDTDLNLIGFMSDTCAVKMVHPLRSRPNMLFFPFTRPGSTPRYVGCSAVLATTAEDGRKCLMIRGFNPRRFLTNEVHVGDLFEKFSDYLSGIAKTMGYDAVITPDETFFRGTLTNESLVVQHVNKKYKQPGFEERTVALKDPSTVTFNDLTIDKPCLLIREC